MRSSSARSISGHVDIAGFAYGSMRPTSGVQNAAHVFDLAPLPLLCNAICPVICSQLIARFLRILTRLDVPADHPESAVLTVTSHHSKMLSQPELRPE